MIIRTVSLVIGLLLFSGAFHTSKVEACQICVPYPKTTQTDLLIESDSIVLAREIIGKPYSFRVVEVLKGTVGGDEFEGFINSTARHTLSRNPEDIVVFGRTDSETDWRYMAYANIDYRAFIRKIINQAESWQQANGNRQRIDFFANYLTHSNTRIGEQAYLEVGRASYASIKRIAGSIPRQQIRGFLDNWRRIEWHSLYILMLGQSRQPEDLAYIRKNLEAAAAYGLKINLSAWATAFIEAYPETGIEEIENLYFGTKSRTQAELEEILRSMSVLGSYGGNRVDREFVNRRRRIVSSYGTLLENHPMMAGWVAKDLTVWKISAFADRLSNIIESEPALEPDSKMAITYYLSITSKFPRIESMQ